MKLKPTLIVSGQWLANQETGCCSVLFVTWHTLNYFPMLCFSRKHRLRDTNCLGAQRKQSTRLQAMRQWRRWANLTLNSTTEGGASLGTFGLTTYNTNIINFLFQLPSYMKCFKRTFIITTLIILNNIVTYNMLYYL